MITKKNIREFFKFGTVPVIVASLCCLSPVILVLTGISSVAFATSLANIQYGQYAWAFRLVGLLTLLVSIIIYLRREKGICTFDQALKRRNEIINIVMLGIIGGVIAYVIFLYGIVEIVGIFLKIW